MPGLIPKKVGEIACKLGMLFTTGLTFEFNGRVWEDFLMSGLSVKFMLNLMGDYSV